MNQQHHQHHPTSSEGPTTAWNRIEGVAFALATTGFAAGVNAAGCAVGFAAGKPLAVLTFGALTGLFSLMALSIRNDFKHTLSAIPAPPPQKRPSP